MPGDTPTLSKSELFARLAEGHAAGITVVTPNRRLAQVLRADFDTFQTGKGLAVWEDADILPLSSFVERAYEDALYADGAENLPMLLTGAQERELWEEAVRGSQWAGILLDVPRTAQGAMDAWKLANAWRISGALEKFQDTEDVRAFADWARAYVKRCRKDGLIDAASLFDASFHLKKPKLLVAYAFDIVPAQVKDFFAAFEHAICKPEERAGTPSRASFASPQEELDTAARWARARLESGARNIGVVVPDLEQRRREVARVFTRTMGSAAVFNISIGERLAGYPLVSFALGLFQFCNVEKPFEEVSRLLRSPFLGGADTEMSSRALLDARLRRDRAPAKISLPKLISILDVDSSLRRHLELVYKRVQEQPRSPQQWAEHYTDVLKAAGFPGERTLDSAEYQTQVRFNEVLGEFARLSLVNPSMNAKSAFNGLKRLCGETLFQPETAQAPVQVLGLLESAGLEFDALWVCGLTDDAWPLRSRPSPFLPLGLQRMAGIPESSAEGSLELDRRLTAGWRRAADEVVLSWPRRIEDRNLSPSPLILSVAEAAPDVPGYPSWRDLIFAARRTDAVEDAQAPPVATQAFRGGTRVLADQAACPFRAFAHWRLGARQLDSPEQRPDALDRGTLLHALMAGIWREAKVVSALNEDLILRSAKAAVAEQKLEGRFAALEVQRLVKLAREWLDTQERTRKPFEVVHVEQKRSLRVAGLEFAGRIDRMDRLEDLTHALIDYKTGADVSRGDWKVPRMDDPQLPLYAVAAEEEVSVLAFGKLRAGDMRFIGYSDDEGKLPGIRNNKNTPAFARLMEGWKQDLATLAGGFAAGEAAVDPKYKRSLATCQNCDLHPLCRVHEKLGGPAEEDAEE